MRILDLIGSVDTRAEGRVMHALMARLQPIPRSITGQGLRETLSLLGETIPLTITRVPSGTPVLDWTIPREWNLREAWIADTDGKRIVDLAASPLHVVGYSTPVRARMSLSALRPHLYSLPEQPDLVPYRASYYREAWGFCLAHRVLESLPEGEYEVCIDSTLSDGTLDYAECVVQGDSPGEVLISAHVCHPALCNDNLSGVVLAHALARILEGRSLHHCYRFLFIPTIIGSIAWLSANQDAPARVRHGLVLACAGDAGAFTYKRSRQGGALIDRAAAHVVSHRAEGGRTLDFVPYGYDERNYGSPGFDLPVGVFSRTPHGEFPQYHTSADDLSFVTAEALGASLEALLSVVEVIENETRCLNLSPRGEPRLGPRGLYESTGGQARTRADEMALFWVLNQSDGRHSLLDIAERARLPFHTVAMAASRLAGAGLVAAAEA